MNHRTVTAFLGTWVCSLCIAGCAHLNNPFQDSSAGIDSEMQTPSSVDYSQKKSEFALVHGRTWATSDAIYQNGAVTHWPLWFEDPFEDKGNDPTNPNDRDAPDNHFNWNAVDYFAIAYSPAREFVNVVGWPISAIVTPPGTLMESDGHIDKGLLGYDHDSKRADSATREPPQVSNVTHSTQHIPESPQPAAAP
jgi:hypothetical protein